jgi:hypothetical protein
VQQPIFDDRTCVRGAGHVFDETLEVDVRAVSVGNQSEMVRITAKRAPKSAHPATAAPPSNLCKRGVSNALKRTGCHWTTQASQPRCQC